jgi:hypothetical protein
VAGVFYPVVKVQNGLILDNSVMLTIGKVDVGLFLEQRVLQQAGVQSFLSASKPSGKKRRMSLASTQQQWGSAQRPSFSISTQTANQSKLIRFQCA